MKDESRQTTRRTMPTRAFTVSSTNSSINALIRRMSGLRAHAISRIVCRCGAVHGGKAQSVRKATPSTGHRFARRSPAFIAQMLRQSCGD